MGKMKSMIMDQEDKLNEYIWFIVAECETFQEFAFKAKLFAKTECNLSDEFYDQEGLSEVWNEFWSNLL